MSRTAGALALLFGAVMAVAVSCGVADDKPPPPSGYSSGAGASTTGSTTGAGASAPCPDGSTRSCHVTLGQHNGVLSCFDGMQTCTNGTWGACTDGTTTERPAPTGGAMRGIDEGAGLPSPLSLSSPVNCVDNPCDPSCQAFNEVPDGGVIPQQTIASTYAVGSVSSIPAGFIGNGLFEPCGAAEDCEFDEVCTNPAKGGCVHNVCVTGEGLVATCNSCATEVCAADSTCCSPSSGTCSHDKCQAGAALDSTCDTCVGQVCATDPTCCTVSQGSCSHSPCDTGASLASGCDSCVTSICQAEPSCCGPVFSGTCAHSPCAGGGALDATCDTCVGGICGSSAALEHCCTPTFSASCAHSPCTTGAALTATCDSCVDDICTNKDKGCCGTASTFSATCSSGAGHSPCVIGKRLSKFCDTCVTNICSDPAFAYCCSATGPTAWDQACLDAVNTHCAPLSCDTTWTQHCSDLVATDTACGGKTCTPSWDQTCINAVATTTACGGTTCTPSWDSTCVAKVASVCNKTCTPSWTASCAGKVGTVCNQQCGTWQQSCVDKVASVCGSVCNEPAGACAHNKCYTGPALSASCDTCVGQICAAHPECCSSYWNSTCKDYVASICGQTCPVAGDCVPWNYGQTNQNCAGADLTAGVPCTGNVPICNRGNTAVASGVKVYVYPSGYAKWDTCTPDVTSPPVLGICTVPAPIQAGQCVSIQETNCTPTSGTSPILSPGVLLMVNPPIGSANGEVTECYCADNWTDYHTGTCTSGSNYQYAATTYSQLYTSNCPAGTHVQWAFLAYDTFTPGDSNIIFQVHTADTDPITTPLTQVALAHASPSDTEVCPMSGPAPCPIDLFAALNGLPAATALELELVVTLNPTSDAQQAPTLTDWEITFSCPPSE